MRYGLHRVSWEQNGWAPKSSVVKGRKCNHRKFFREVKIDLKSRGKKIFFIRRSMKVAF